MFIFVTVYTLSVGRIITEASQVGWPTCVTLITSGFGVIRVLLVFLFTKFGEPIKICLPTKIYNIGGCQVNCVIIVFVFLMSNPVM